MADMERIDAYAHVGLPRFGSLEQVLASMALWNIQKSVLVLGPMVPDYETIFEAAARLPGRVRCIGIPFGETEERRYELAELALRGGLIGLRMDRGETLGNPRILELLGERGGWIFAPGAELDDRLCETLLDWLDRYPQGRIAAPHFLKAGDAAERELLRPKTEALVSHERFYPILSRHGGMGSKEAYPHRDFLPWVRRLLELKGWENVLWGSEYPVLYWRGETMASVQRWIEDSGLAPAVAELRSFAYGNAERLFFRSAAPPAERIELPAWVSEQFNKNRTVPVLADRTLELPMDRYEALWTEFVRTEAYASGRTFSEFLIGQWKNRKKV